VFAQLGRFGDLLDGKCVRIHSIESTT
jgi:hypothetical protein